MGIVAQLDSFASASLQRNSQSYVDLLSDVVSFAAPCSEANGSEHLKASEELAAAAREQGETCQQWRVMASRFQAQP